MIRKNTVPFSLILALLCTSVSAQVQYGIKAGTQVTTAKVITPEGYEPPVNPSWNFHLGVEARIPFDNHLFFLPQFQYAHKVFDIQYGGEDTFTENLSIHYIEIPVLLDFETNPSGKGWIFQAGPSFSVALQGYSRVTGKNGSASGRKMVFAFTDYGRFEANAVANIGYRFSPGIAATIGYAFGLGSIVDDDYGPEIKPRMATISLHYWLRRRSPK